MTCISTTNGMWVAVWALAALGTVYGRDMLYSGPMYHSMKKKKSEIRLKFDNCAGGLKTSDSRALREFIIAGADQVFHPAEAKIVGCEIVVSSREVPRPVAVRYGWSDIPNCNLVIVRDCPASPFCTDKWKWVTEGRLIPSSK